MSLGFVAILFGEAFLFKSFGILVYAVIFFGPIHLFVVGYEEHEHEQKFGEEYKKYCSEVPRWIPRLPRSGGPTGV